MWAVILLGCTVAGFALYLLVVRPLLVPLTSRIPTGREYRATLARPR